MYTLEDIRRYCKERGKKKVMVDTNLLLLFLVGSCDINFLSSCESTSKYSKNDHQLLLGMLRYFDSEIVITPHVLAEFSNLSRRDIKEPRLSYYLATVLDALKRHKEEHVPLEIILKSKINVLSSYGFTDISITEAALKINAVILTDDIGLGLYADSKNIANIKFAAAKADMLISR